MLSRQNEMYFSYISKIEDKRKRAKKIQNLFFEKQGPEVFEYIKNIQLKNVI